MRIVPLGWRCNNACIFCAAAEERLEAHPEPSPEERTRLAAQAVHGETVAFVGGDPTLYDALPDLVASVRERGVRVVVQTNARRLAYPAYARFLADAGVAALDVSLHGSTDAMHDYHTQVPGSFGQTARGVSNAVAAGIRVVLSCVVTRSNYRNLVEIVQVAKAVGANAVRFQAPRLAGRGLAARDRILPHPELVTPYLRGARTAGRKIGVDVVTGAAVETADFVPFVADRIEPAGAASSEAPPEPDRVTFRALPGRHERRVRDLRTGADLREILPGFFDDDPERS